MGSDIITTSIKKLWSGLNAGQQFIAAGIVSVVASLSPVIVYAAYVHPWLFSRSFISSVPEVFVVAIFAYANYKVASFIIMNVFLAVIDGSVIAGKIDKAIERKLSERDAIPCTNEEDRKHLDFEHGGNTSEGISLNGSEMRDLGDELLQEISVDIGLNPVHVSSYFEVRGHRDSH